MKPIPVLALLLLPSIALADPAPFGLEIGKTTIQDVKAKYKAQNTGINKFSHGEMYDLDVSTVGFDGLKKATVIFSQQGKLLAVLTSFPNSKFDSLLDGLSGKYKLISKQIPFVGNRSAKFIDGNTEITLIAPHMSFDMEMNYINKNLISSYKVQSNEEQQQKRKGERSQL